MSRVTRRKVITKRSSGPPQSTRRITRRSAQGKADAATQRKAIRRGTQVGGTCRRPLQGGPVRDTAEAKTNKANLYEKSKKFQGRLSPSQKAQQRQIRAKAKRAKLKGLLSTPLPKYTKENPRKKMPTRDELARGSKASIRRSLSLKKIMGR